jgi:hypothetical protein
MGNPSVGSLVMARYADDGPPRTKLMTTALKPSPTAIAQKTLATNGDEERR